MLYVVLSEYFKSKVMSDSGWGTRVVLSWLHGRTILLLSYSYCCQFSDPDTFALFLISCYVSKHVLHLNYKQKKMIVSQNRRSIRVDLVPSLVIFGRKMSLRKTDTSIYSWEMGSGAPRRKWVTAAAWKRERSESEVRNSLETSVIFSSSRSPSINTRTIRG